MIYIGVDPAFRDGGFRVAVVDMQRKCIEFRVMRDLFDWYEFVKCELSAQPNCFICIEDSSSQNLTFDMRGNRSEIARRSRNVGCNQAVSHLAVVAARKFMPFGRVFAISPREKGAKIQSRHTFDAFVNLHGLTILKKGVVTQDERDAFKLAMMLPTLIKFGHASARG